MKVLLISANTERINMPVLPLGLACVAEAVQKVGHDVKLLNLMTEQDAREVLRETIKQFEPEVIGISVRNIDDQSMENPRFLLEPVQQFVDDCRKLSQAPVVLGGAGYSIYPQSALDFLGADMGIQGEGEKAFATLLECLSRQDEPSNVPGLHIRGRGLQTKTSPVRHLDEFPLPMPDAHGWLPSGTREQKIWVPFQTRRGCPMDCSYCSTATIEGRNLRSRSPDAVVEALARYVEAGFKRFIFVDNTFNLPPSYAKSLCDRLAASGLKISWNCIVYPWKVDEELVEKMAGAGCRGISLGSESGSHPMLKAFNKKFEPEDVRRISDLFKRYDIQRMGFLLLGGPGENKETVLESLEFTDALNLDTVKVTMGIRIYPYTALAQTAAKEKIIAPNDNLLFPTFYMAKGLKNWLRKTIRDWMADRPHWVT
ncbi:MAG: radical SAM protein [Deltaproteobacteria bacterium]|nr:radical SAM protein [Deltaproteobacteria bacterium]